ncbi:MAG: GIN domain-containing protein, partial [Bacteroidia bacterium]
IDQSDNVLVIDLDEEHFNFKTRPKVIITMPQLLGVKLSGVTIGKIAHFAGEDLNLDLSGASKATIDAEYNEINVGISGVSHLNISGSAKTIKYEGSGASHVDSKNLTVNNVNVDLSGATKIVIGTAKNISGELSGACKLEYIGNPTLDVNSSGVSKIRQVGQ